MAVNDDIVAEIEEEDDNGELHEELPKSDQEIEDAYANNVFRVIYQTNNFLLPQLRDLINGREVLNLRPEYQRRLRWSAKKKSLLIESLLLNIPVPPIYFFENDLARYEVMDGQQRLNAIHEFLENDFVLTGMVKMAFLNGRRYSRLPPKVRRGLDRASVSAIVLLQETRSDEKDPYLVRRYVFERLNTGGEKLNAQELRNSIYKGDFNDLVVELARNPSFCRIFNIPVYSAVDDNEYYENETRQKNTLYRTMGDCQLVLRSFALMDDDRISGSMRSILDRYMRDNKDISQLEIEAKRNSFSAVIEACEAIFGEETFRLPPDKSGRRRVSAALYDSITVSLMRRIDNLPKFVEKGFEIKASVDALLDRDLDLMTGQANTSDATKKRLAAVGSILDSIC
ncbi:hypothetical protein GCM10011316_03290 [Roseibium aquae]|uniref:GmrSD restriction endonucleases N-terminal domain-containing protein n=1 Tax=Roseibium aquae TaxID=1323746 RepID=A0A916WUW1_9HYPH|nr:DUF262 domain-containing protein [Roseibium aquae]GGB34561.1 hypothetical protein GCM10011316_03290 [Roseibium aquae]